MIQSILLNLFKKIKYPLYSSDCISQKNFFEIVGETFALSNGGRFISDKNAVSDTNLPIVLEIITSLLKYDEDLIPKNEGCDQNSNIYVGKYDFLPSMFLNLAFHSRIDSGYRLLDRCARHTTDPKCGSIFFQNATFCQYDCEESGQKG